MEPKNKTCARCGAAFGCLAPARGCWCESLPPLPRQAPEHDCLCPSCLKEELRSQQAASPTGS